MRQKLLFHMASVILCLLLLTWCLREIDWDSFKTIWREIRLPCLLSAGGLIALIPFIKTLQWKLFVLQTGDISLRRLFQAMGVRITMMNLLPSWMGELVSVYWFARRESLSPAVLLSILSLDRLADTFSLIVVFAIVVVLVDLPPWYQQGMTILVILFLVLFSGAFWLAHRHRVADTRGPFSTGRDHFFARWSYHLHLLRDPKMLLLALSLSLVAKGAAVGSVFLVHKALDLNLPLVAPFLVIASIELATFLPLTPANLGVFEAALLLVYRSLGLETTWAFSVGFLCHLVFFLPYIAVGLATLMVGVLIHPKSSLELTDTRMLASKNRSIQEAL